MLVIAVFIIVVFGVLATAFSKIYLASQTSVSYEVLGIRSTAAAEAGIDVGIYRILREGMSCTQMNAAGNNPATVISLNLDSNEPALSQCSVAVVCGQRVPPSGATSTYFLIESSAHCQAGTEKLTVNRVLRAEVQR